MKTQDIEYHAGGERFVGYLAVEEKAGQRPGVLLAPEGPGLGELCKGFARKLAQLGYVAFAMDYHGDGEVLTDMGEVMGRLGGFMADPDGIRVIAAEALRVLTAQPETDKGRLAAIGYCFGGTTALELARSGAPLKAVVGFHSGLGAARPAEPGAVKAVVLTQIGADDPIIPPEQRAAFEAEMTKAGADWRMIVYGGAGHSFTNPDVGAVGRIGFAYNEAADKRAWRAMLDLFDEVFGPV